MIPSKDSLAMDRLDLRKKLNATKGLSKLEVDGEAEGGGSKALFLEKVRQSNAACQSGDFETAVALYTEAIALDPHNHILYSNRSAAHIKLAKFAHALQDATKARELNPKWPKVSRYLP
ncbi:tetratricopeptide repeat protein 28-like isoform X2 [Penaeus chinensis]|uniref:tetratricopeptide repeat protein 28-like isoform X2 n=1 Tax=Penaeus chinensis TaxID=139456 RepID=UPI001FB74503|nr:tetratricopeptide repeat protein 28-like isoform X2 [Penaeus chinensis]